MKPHLDLFEASCIEAQSRSDASEAAVGFNPRTSVRQSLRHEVTAHVTLGHALSGRYAAPRFADPNRGLKPTADFGPSLRDTRQSLVLAFALFVVGILQPVVAESPVRPGDRIAFVGNTFADQLRMYGYLETLLLQRSIDKPISIRNLGWAGDMLTARDRPTNFPTEESTLTAHKTDVIIACFGMGESFAGEAGMNAFKEDLQDFIASHKGKQYNGKTEVRLILISPVAYEDHGNRTPNWERRNRELSAYTRAMNAVAKQAGLPFVDLNRPTSDLMEDYSAPKMTGNGVNLNDYGYWCVSRTLADALIAGPKPWRLNIDAGTGKGSGKGVEVADVNRAGEGIRFKVSEKSWPTLGAPVKGKVHRSLDGNRDRLIVRNLPAGDYQLTIEGKAVASASAEQWAEGVAITTSPAHQTLQAYRDAIYDKNVNFVYSWKALNQVHIVGERRKSNSGRALPAEVIEFNKIAIAKDEALAKGIELKTREWRLEPAK